jgi:hypothetical protein
MIHQRTNVEEEEGQYKEEDHPSEIRSIFNGLHDIPQKVTRFITTD